MAHSVVRLAARVNGSPLIATGARASASSLRFDVLPAPCAGIINRSLHASAAVESATLAAAGVGIAAAAVAARYAVNVYTKANAGSTEGAADKKISGENDSASSESTGQAGASASKPASSSSSSSGGGMFSAQSMARRFYKGGFEDKMTRREASLILGVR